MIEKIEMPEMAETYQSAMFAKILGNKINQLVDAVNEFGKDMVFLRRKVLELGYKDPQTRPENVQPDAESRPVNVLKWIHGEDDEAQRYGSVARGFKSLRKEPADPYAEQRKWIGKACWFWDGNAQTKAFGKLIQIDPLDDGQNAPYQTNYGQWYEHCEPANDDVIYRGE